MVYVGRVGVVINGLQLSPDIPENIWLHSFFGRPANFGSIRVLKWIPELGAV